MKRQMIRGSLAAMIVAVTFLAASVWSAKYDKDPDPDARFVIKEALVRRDHSYYWMELHLRKSGEADHDLRKPVRLVTTDGELHEPADTTFAGNQGKGFTDIWFKFWLSKEDIREPLNLRINDGSLRVKTNSGIPVLGSDDKSVFKSANWGKSWLGFS